MKTNNMIRFTGSPLQFILSGTVALPFSMFFLLLGHHALDGPLAGQYDNLAALTYVLCVGPLFTFVGVVSNPMTVIVLFFLNMKKRAWLVISLRAGLIVFGVIHGVLFPVGMSIFILSKGFGLADGTIFHDDDLVIWNPEMQIDERITLTLIPIAVVVTGILALLVGLSQVRFRKIFDEQNGY